ncbi:hypothetical protein [Streptomyces sp. NBC_00557]|uniref:hypothetical protein n=1 Tax=Streptomyces sp. NBC_00557 TaxID=2975776 RepID=UPI002E82259D|nr:hypothetical protein [Streptomyces sp. NBC_00557]WUC39681.1 hypothetical protein OG956_38640 [Streptomyces sp. NBC_00557]
MSEQLAAPDDFGTWLTERGPDAYALAWVADQDTPTGELGADKPVAGRSGIDRPGADLTRITVHEVTHGRQETLRRWLQLDDGRRQLAIVSADAEGLREHTPGELAVQLMHDPDTDDAQLTQQLADWLYRRNIDADQALELGWIAAAAAWTCHMRDLSGFPPASVRARSLAMAGDLDEDTEALLVSAGQRTSELLDRMDGPFRPRAELVDDWHTAENLAADIPALRETADWLLDQIALRDAGAQQLRAVLEPDITDYQRAAADGAAPRLDEARAAHLAQARATVRAYTAAVHSGREQQAQQILDAFPVPARSLECSGPATAWRRESATAQEAIDALAAQRAATTAEEGGDYVADPELLHARTAYLAAREAQLHCMHDALGRLAHPLEPPHGLPDELAPVAAAQIQRRLIEAFGTTDRARQVLDGQISYRLQQPPGAHQRTTTQAETDLLIRVRDALEEVPGAGTPLDAEDIRTRAEHFRARLEYAMAQQPTARPGAPAGPERAASTAHAQAHAQALAADVTTPGVQR